MTSALANNEVGQAPQQNDSTLLLAVDRVAAVVLIGLMLAAFYTNIGAVFSSSDTAWLLKSGQYILKHGLPAGDPFSWTKPGDAWVLYQWLFEVLAASFYQFGGLRAVGFVAALAAGAVLLVLLPWQMLRAGVRAAYAFGLSYLVICDSWFFIRPQLMSFLLIPVFVMILERFRQHNDHKWLYALPPLMVLWANVHSFWFIGLLLIAAYLLPAARQHKQLGIVLLLSFAGVLVNPYGFNLVSYNWSFLHTTGFASLYELRPQLLTNWVENANRLSYLLIASAVILIGRKHLPVQCLGIAICSVVSALCFYRFFPVAVLLTWPYLALVLGQMEGTRRKHTGNFERLSIRALPVVSMLSVALMFCLQFPASQQIWFTHSHSNAGAIQFLKKHPELVDGMYCDAAFGCSQIFENLTPVFIDTRFDFYGNSFYDAWLKTLNAYGDWQSYLRQWKIKTVAVSSQYKLKQALDAAPDWECLFDDKLNAVYVRRNQIAAQSSL